MHSQRDSFLYKVTQIFLILGAAILIYLTLMYVNGSGTMQSIFQGAQDPLSGIIGNLDAIGRGISNMFVGFFR